MTGVQAIEVKTEAVINHGALGRQFFEWDNHEQARFLHGMTLGLDALGGYGHLQINYIVESAEERDLSDGIRRLVSILHEYFKEAD